MIQRYGMVNTTPDGPEPHWELHSVSRSIRSDDEHLWCRAEDVRVFESGRAADKRRLSELEAREKRMWELLGKAEDLLDGSMHRGQDPACEVCKWIEAVGALTIIPAQERERQEREG